MISPEKKSFAWSALPVSIILFLLLFYFSYPFYHYYIDPDAVAYLAIAKRYAAGNWQQAINGMWSPLHPFLSSLFIRGGMDALRAAHVVNAIASCGILTVCGILFHRFRLSNFQIRVLLFSLPFVLAYYHYLQLFGDLWSLFFLLLFILIITAKDFKERKWLWVMAGVVASLAAYSKAYSLYFITFFLFVTAILSWRKNRRMKDVVAAITVFVVMILLQLPWIFQIHKKYGVWSNSTSGIVNASWFLVPEKEYSSDIKILVPPPYPDSPTEWEDPWMTKGPAHSKFESAATIQRQVMLTGHATALLVQACNEISPFLLVILLGTLIYVSGKKNQKIFDKNDQLLLWAACLMPLGYLMLFVEARYIWFMGFMAMILGMRWLNASRTIISDISYKLSVLLLALSFLAWPLIGMKKLYLYHHRNFELAEQLRVNNIHGSFASNDPVQEDSWTLAFLSDNQCYTMRPGHYANEELIQELRRYHVQYFLDYRKYENGFAAASGTVPVAVLNGITVYRLY